MHAVDKLKSYKYSLTIWSRQSLFDPITCWYSMYISDILRIMYTCASEMNIDGSNFFLSYL